MKKASHTDLTEKLGQKIRIERMKRKMSQEKLAELAELNRNFTVKNLENISKAFNMEIKELFNFVL